MGSRDFTYNLILKQDKESWKNGAQSVDKLANNVSRLIGTAAIATAAMGAMALASAKLGAEDMAMSDTLGVSVKRLEEWKVAAQIAGASSGELIKSIGTLDRKFTELKYRGKIDSGVDQALAQLGLSTGEMIDMSADERARRILQAASTMKDTKNAAALVSQLLGGAGEKMYHYMNLSGESVDSLLAKSKGLSLVDDKSARKGFEFSTELNTTIAALKQLGTLAGLEIGGQLTGFLSGVNQFFEDHGADLAKRITGFSESLSKIGKAIEPFAKGALKIAIDALFDLTDALAKILTGDLEGGLDKIADFYNKQAENLRKLLFGDMDKVGDAYKDTKDKGGSTIDALDAATNTFIENGGVAGKIVGLVDKGKNYALSKLFSKDELAAEQSAIISELTGGANAFKRLLQKKKSFESLSPEMQDRINAYLAGGGKEDDLKYYVDFGKSKMNDGIMRPDGRVTQVAPDDWVFAARNIGDLAKMFIPQSATTTNYGGSTYTINQTLNFQGAPFAQAAKRAAYEGTSQALRSLSDSAQRLQLMPGLR